MENTATISLDLYNELRNAKVTLGMIERGAVAIISINSRDHGCGIYVSEELVLLNKDETILVLKDQIKDLQCRLDEEKDKLVKFRIEQESKKKKWWFWPR